MLLRENFVACCTLLLNIMVVWIRRNIYGLILTICFLETYGSSLNIFERTLTECENTNSTLCFVLLLGSQTVTLYRKNVTTVGLKGMVAKLTRTNNDEVEVTLIAGGTEKIVQWISFAVSETATGSMGNGSPTFICMFYRKASSTEVGFLGDDKFDFVFTSFGEVKVSKFPSLVADDFFKDGIVTHVHVDGYIYTACTFKIGKEIRTLAKSKIDIKITDYNIILAQGRIAENEFVAGENETLRPVSHRQSNRYIAGAKYFLSKTSDDQSKHLDYLPCGITRYCFGAGYDGCGTATFDCKLFVRFEKRNEETLRVILKSLNEHKFIGLGFSNTSEAHVSFTRQEWRNLQFVIVCDPQIPEPTFVRLDCSVTSDQTLPCIMENRTQIAAPIISVVKATTNSTVINSKDLLFSHIRCEFDITFANYDLVMMRSKNVRLLFTGIGTEGQEDWLSELKILPVNEMSLAFSNNDNTELLQQGVDIPPKAVWQILKEEEEGITDPANLNPRLSVSTKLESSLVLILLVILL